MQNELLLEKSEYKNQNNNENSVINLLKEISHDSLFYFGIFLSIIAVLHFFPFITGLNESFNIGVNEVAVCLMGFGNVFIFQVYNKIFKKAN